MEKRVCILMGSPRKDGNTMHLLKPFMDELRQGGCACELIWLYEKEIQPCCACCCCQNDHAAFGCALDDDMQGIAESVLRSDLLVLATPIYSWYCTPPMKAALDRLVYGMNKYYGERKESALWEGKRVALLTTCGYPIEKGADLWESGVRRYCKHSQLRYMGMLAEHDPGYRSVFMDEEKAARAGAFAQELLCSFEC